MSYSSSYRDESLVVHRESMLENEVLGIGEESNSSFGSFVSLSLFDEENFQNLMMGPEITSVVKVVVETLSAVTLTPSLSSLMKKTLNIGNMGVIV